MRTRLRLGIGVALLTASLGAQQAYSPPKTPWGDPDLRGTYASDDAIGVPLERPARFGARPTLTESELAARDRANQQQIANDNADRPETPFAKDEAANDSPRHWLERGTKVSNASSIIVDPPNGRLPLLTPEGRRHLDEVRWRYQFNADSAEAHTIYDRCITRGVVGSILPVSYGNGTRILQGPGYVAIQNEMIHETRLVPVGSKAPRLGRKIRLYMGDPRGRWDGNRLVVDSRNFTDKTGIGPNGNGALHSASLHLVETFTRTAPDTIRYEFTVDDPLAFTAPWSGAVDLRSRPGYAIYEYACHEGNYAMTDMLSAARAGERASR